MTTTADVNELPARIGELIDQVIAGNEVVLTRDERPVARIVSAGDQSTTPPAKNVFVIPRPHKSKVLKPNFTHAEIAEEMFGER